MFRKSPKVQTGEEELSQEHLEAIAGAIEDSADLLRGYKEEKGVKIQYQAREEHVAHFNEVLMRRGAKVIRDTTARVQKCKETQQRVKMAGALLAAFLALATALVNQSAAWATHNLSVAYTMLIIGAVAVAIAAYLGFFNLR